MSRLEGRVVVVTGAAGGIGAAIVAAVAAAGGEVVAADRVPPEYAPRAARAQALDVTNEADWARLAARLTGTPVAGLVNAAGVTHRARLGQVAREDWDRTIAVNLTGAMLGIQALVPLMGAGGSIVNVGSSAALNGHYPVAYTASKWGLRGLTHAAATEFGPRGIRVNIVHPGFIETPMTASASPAFREANLDLIPMERTGEPDEVARVVAFLLSDAAYVSGAEIPIDGAATSSAGAKLIADRIATASNTPTS